MVFLFFTGYLRFLSFHNNSWVNVMVRQRQQMSWKLWRTITGWLYPVTLERRGEVEESDAAEV